MIFAICVGPIILLLWWLSSSWKDFGKSWKLKRKFSDWFSTFTYFMEFWLVWRRIFTNFLFIEYLHRRMDGLSWIVQPANIEHLVRKTFIKYSTKLCVYSIIFDKIWQLTKKVLNNNFQIFSEVRIFTINFRLLKEFRNGLQKPPKGRQK